MWNPVRRNVPGLGDSGHDPVRWPTDSSQRPKSLRHRNPTTRSIGTITNMTKALMNLRRDGPERPG